MRLGIRLLIIVAFTLMLSSPRLSVKAWRMAGPITGP